MSDMENSMVSEEKKQILNMLQEGKITAEEAENLLDSLQALEHQEKDQATAHEAEQKSDKKKEEEDDFEGIKIKIPKIPPIPTIDLSFLKDELKNAFKGISESLEDIDLDINLDLSRREQAERTITTEMNIDGIKELRIHNTIGNITFDGQDTDTVLVVSRCRVKGNDEEKCREIAEAIELRCITEEGILDISHPKHHDHHFKIRIDHTITLPKSLKVLAQSRSGNLEVSNISGGVNGKTFSGNIEASRIQNLSRLETYSGSVELSQSEGEIQLISRSGSIEISDTSGALVCQALSGSIEVSNCSGSLELNSKSGSIEARNCSGSFLSAVSVSGSVESDFTPLGREVTILGKSTSGSVEIEVPENTSAHVNLTTVSGSAEVDFDDFSGSRTKKKIEGIIGNESNGDETTGAISLISTSGSVTLRKH